MGQNSSLTVSVVIPVKDRQDSLLRAIGSVMVQRFKATEVIIVDDGSAVPVEPIVRSKYPEVICLRNEQSMGAPNARNKGWRRASSQVIAFLDSDDEMLPDCLGNKVAKLADDNLDLVVGPFIIEVNEALRPYLFHVSTDQPLRDHLLMNTKFDARSSTMVVRRSVLEDICFDENLKKHQDWDLFMNIDSRYRTGFTNECDVILHISENDRISSKLKHDSTRYFIEKNRDKVSHDAIFLFALKMLYKSSIRNDIDGIGLYKNYVLSEIDGISLRYRLIAFMIKYGILNVTVLHFLKRLITVFL